MIRERDRRALFGLLALSFGALSACATTARVYPQLEARRSRIARAAVLAGMIAAKLREQGLAVIEGVGAANSDLRFQATELQATFDQALGDLFQEGVFQTPQASRSLGPQAARVADPLGVDALALVRIEGYTKSGGEVAKDWAKTVAGATLTLGVLVPVPSPMSGAAIVSALIDGGTGDVLWTNVVSRSSPVSFDTPGLQALVNAVFKDFPPGGFGATPAVKAGEN